ncbi:hypothetical protein HKCCA1058_01290 [Rhodobacterales bacterium HKCCA1058]|nr:hypothetical protein [Rhodobacterales bacterium HKCCA1058]
MIRRTALQLLLGGAAALPITAMLAGQARASSDGGGSSGGTDSSSLGSFGGNDDGTSGSFSSDSSNGTSGSFGGSAPNSPSGPDDTLSGSSSNDDLLRLRQTQNIDQSLNDDGLEPVSMDNLANVLADFQ